MSGVTCRSTTSGVTACSMKRECAITVATTSAPNSPRQKPSDASHNVTRALVM